MLTEIAGKPLWIDDQGEGPVVVMVHGLGGTSTFYEAQARTLQASHRVIRFDLEGHGRSPLVGTPNIATWAADVLALCDHLGIEQFHLVGHSMGTLVVQHLAAQAPERVQRVALLGVVRELPDAARENTRARAETVRASSVAAVADGIADAATGPATKRDRPEIVGFVRELLLRQTDEGYAAGCDALASSTDTDLSAISQPVLLITGSDDGVSPPSKNEAINGQLADSSLVVVDGIGHWTAIEAPERVSKELAAFLA
jgi:pimeloyl-ACP methyl ester carboxylesterase